MLDKIVAVTVSQRPMASVVALVVMSVLACVALTACDASAGHRPPGAAARPTALMTTLPPMPAATATAPAAPQGAAALQEYREDADPSHAAIASYRD